MDTERIAAILKVLEAGSLSAAAEQLGYTVSGLSRQISSLEQETGLVLLHREHRGVSPTPACRELLGPMRQMLAAEEHYRQRAAALMGMELGTLRIGCAYDSYFPYLCALVPLDQFLVVHPLEERGNICALIFYVAVLSPSLLNISQEEPDVIG